MPTPNRKLCIVQILPALEGGGVERGTLEIARALVAAGHRSIVISNGGRLTAQLVQEGSEHITLPVHRKSLLSLFQVRPLRTLLARLKPDILHARSRVPAWIATLALRKMQMPNRPHFVTTVHGLYSVNAYSAIMTTGDRVIAVSETVRDYVLTHYRSCPPEKIRLIYRGVSTDEFPYGYTPSEEWLAHWRMTHPQLQRKIVLALPGRITRLKGHEDFIRLIGKLSTLNEHIHGLIIGGAEKTKQPYLAELHEHVRAAGLESHVTFTGHRSDIRDVLSQCDLVLSLTTKPETFGRAVLEALRLGRPVIGWDAGGVGEILRVIYPFGAIPMGDQDTLTLRCQTWLESPLQPTSSDHFQLSEMCSRTLAVYNELLDTSLK